MDGGAEDPASLEANGEAGRGGLARLIDTTIALSPNQQQSLRQALERGEAFYDHYNEARLELAFSSFDREMRLAVYELLFLLHVNHPRLAHWKYAKKTWSTVKGVRRQVPTEAVADLYLEGAPAGVQMIGRIPALFRDEYESYVKGVFDLPPYGEEQPDHAPIVSIQSVGSIGTIGHKSRDSDLDLQVIYDLVPFPRRTADWNDTVLRNALNQEHRWWIAQLRRKQNVSLESLKTPEVKNKLSQAAAQRIAHAYPGLYKYLVLGDREFAGRLFRQGPDRTLRIQVLHELLNLMKRNEKLTWLNELREQEAKLKERIQRIQDYINTKFPEAEIYLFVYTVEWFRQGSYSSTLEFKESSGSAYEMILNYETLMPGIQFTPVLPIHFVMPDGINNDAPLYTRMIDYIRFQAVDLYEGHRYRFVDLGNTPELNVKYVAGHGGAIYWEAFKASSGNLPKAMLNLFRFEMLLDPHLVKTIIQIVKEPAGINALATTRPSDEIIEAISAPQRRDALAILRGSKLPRSDAAEGRRPQTASEQLEAMGNLQTGLPPWAVLEIEEKFPALLQDPWWLRYKTLKIGFAEDGGVSGIEKAERDRVSKVIDLAFCLHVRISDVLNPRTGRRKDVAPPSHREQVLGEFLERAFPPGTPRRINLENLFAGGVRGLILFENEMRDLFQRSMNRVEQKMAALGVHEHVGDKREVELWLNYYLEHFQPMPTTVPRVIMKHLKVARNGIAIGFRPEEGWAFLSIQQPKLLERSAGSDRNVSYLPGRVLLLEKSGFAIGVAHCILNGYYGVLDKGTPEERYTVVELDDKKLNQGNNIHDEKAFLKQHQVNRLMERIVEAFPYQPYNYMDILRKERTITTAFVMLNLWRFGQVSIIYRDNLSTWYCHEFEVPALFEQALELSREMRRLIRAKPLLDALRDQLRQLNIVPGQTVLHAWANPNSLTPDHTMAYRENLTDMEEGKSFREVLQNMGRVPIGDRLTAVPADPEAAR
jgi:hypothetical protein